LVAIFWNEPDCSDHFTYDTTWGGLITTNAMDDGGADFGQGHISLITSEPIVLDNLKSTRF
jgi:hypothetical protein